MNNGPAGQCLGDPRRKRRQPAGVDGLVERFTPLIWSICRRYQLGGADAEDVGQAVWLRRSLDHLGEIRERLPLAGWPPRPAGNAAGYWARRGDRRLPGTCWTLRASRTSRRRCPRAGMLAADMRDMLRCCEAFTPPSLMLPATDRPLLTGDPPKPYAQISAQARHPGRQHPGRAAAAKLPWEKLRRDPAIARP